MSVSGTYNFSTPPIRQLIEEAYERIGILPALITPQRAQSAQRSMNLILQEWVNLGNNLWTVQQGVVALKANQNAYSLPLGCIDVKTATLRTMIMRILGGTPFSSEGGVAANAFDGNPATSCTQTAPNGYISYNWGAATNIPTMVGIQSHVTTEYTISVEYSLDNTNWLLAVNIPRQTYTQSNLQWYVIPKPLACNQIRIIETGGATLDIEELYFESYQQDMYMARFSESEYTSFPNKYNVGRPSGYWIDRQINPVMYVYLTPDGQYPMIYFTYWCAIQDVGTMQNMAQIPTRFLEALTAALAAKLAIKHAIEINIDPTHIDRLERIAQQAYQVANREDRERVLTRFYQNPQSYNGATP
jgi:hypothetical protein